MFTIFLTATITDNRDLYWICPKRHLIYFEFLHLKKVHNLILSQSQKVNGPRIGTIPLLPALDIYGYNQMNIFSSDMSAGSLIKVLIILIFLMFRDPFWK